MKIEKVHFQSEGMKVIGNLLKPTGDSKEQEELEESGETITVATVNQVF